MEERGGANREEVKEKDVIEENRRLMGKRERKNKRRGKEWKKKGNKTRLRDRVEEEGEGRKDRIIEKS